MVSGLEFGPLSAADEGPTKVPSLAAGYHAFQRNDLIELDNGMRCDAACVPVQEAQAPIRRLQIRQTCRGKALCVAASTHGRCGGVVGEPRRQCSYLRERCLRCHTVSRQETVRRHEGLAEVREMW